MLKLSQTLLILVLFGSCQGVPPKHLGSKGEGGRAFSPCPSSPNCVSSTENPVGDHYIDPIEYAETNEAAYQKMVKVIQKQDNCTIKKQEANYIWAECTSSLFKFVDDLEVYFELDNKIHLKSASRKGYSDFGVNRKRLGEITFNFHQAGNK